MSTTGGGSLPEVVRREAWTYFDGYGIDRAAYDHGVIEWEEDPEHLGPVQAVTFTHRTTGRRLILDAIYADDDGEIMQAFRRFD